MAMMQHIKSIFLLYFDAFFDFDKIKCTGIRNVTKKDMDYASLVIELS